MAGITLDTGALIAIERGEPRVGAYLRAAIGRGVPLVVPAPVLVQVWRGPRSARVANLLSLVFVEPLTEPLARGAGELLGRARTADVVDAVVVLSAANRGDELLTDDLRDITHLAQFVRGLGSVRALSALPHR